MEAIRNAYALVGRFALVYVIGSSLALLAPVFLHWRIPPAAAQLCVAALAGLMGWRAFAKRHARNPHPVEWLVALLACCCLVAVLQLFLNLHLAAHTSRQLRRGLAIVAGTAFALSWWLSRSAGKEPKSREPRTQQRHTKTAPPANPPKIQVRIGFTNLADDPAAEARRQADIRALSPLFEDVLSPEPGKVPAAPVLIVYARLQEDGTIAGMPHPVGIRQLVLATKAEIVILATDNSPDAVQAAIALPGPKTANLVFTLARKGELLPKFLAALFAEMRGGTDMMSAWVKLCPQGPAAARNDLPATLFLAEGGKIAFPVAS